MDEDKIDEGRPYYHQTFGEALLPPRDTRFKIPAIEEAVKIYILGRRALLNTKTIQHDDGSFNLLAQLPAEIRNEIYNLALSNGSDQAHQIWVPRHFKDFSKTQDSSVNILQLSKSVALEAGSLMDNKAIAYVPILGIMNLNHMVESLRTHGIASLAPSANTMMRALTTFRNVRIRLHTQYRPSKDAETKEPEIDPNTCDILGVLRQALRIFVSATPYFRGQAAGESTIKRHCMVHLDHLYSDWQPMVRNGTPWKFWQLASTMSKDRDTMWDVRYFVYATGEKPDEYWQGLEEYLVEQYNEFASSCAKFPNVTFTVEVYGARKWCLEGKRANITRSITPSSLKWPSWPDDAPSRLRSAPKSEGVVALAARSEETEANGPPLSEALAGVSTTLPDTPEIERRSPLPKVLTAGATKVLPNTPETDTPTL